MTMFGFAKSCFEPAPVARAKAVRDEAKPPPKRVQKTNRHRGGGKTWDRHVKFRVSTELWDKVYRNGGSAWLRRLIEKAPDTPAI